MSVKLRLVLIAVLTANTIAHADDAPDVDTNAPPEPKHLLATGQAFDHMGGGVGGAEVTLTMAQSETTLGPFKTNGLGDFQIRADEPLRGKAVVTVHKEAYQDVVVEVELGGPDGPPFVDASMAGAVVLSGTVTSRLEEKPIAGAEIEIEAGYDRQNAKTDADGAFRIEGLSPGTLNLTVKAERFAHERRRIEAAEKAGPQAFVLDPERIATLHVTDEDGQPIRGAGVECLDEDERDYRHLVTDERGKAVVRGLRFDLAQLLVRLTHERYVSSPEFDRTVELPPDTNVSTHGLIMHPAGMVVGTVTDAGTGKPLFGARLSAGRVLSDYQPRAWTDFDGAYRLVGVTPGRMPITVHLADYGPALVEVSVVAGEETTTDFALKPARTITGRIVDEDDKPVADVHVQATRWAGNDTLGLQTLSNQDGQFIIGDAPQDAFEVALYARRFKPLLDQEIAGGKERFDFVLKLDPRQQPGVAGSGPRVGEAAPDFKLTTLDGEALALAELKGKVVLIDFWATWCGPCIGEIPSLQAVHTEFGKRHDFVMLSVSIEDDANKVRAFTEARKLVWQQAVASDPGAADAADKFQVSAIPAIFLIDREGKIAASDLRGTAIVDAVRAALDAETP